MCKLCEALKNEKDKYLVETRDFVILPTKNMKGHKKRIMIVLKEHLHQEEVFEEFFVDYFIDFCKVYFDEPTFCLNEPTYATIPEHWHLVAADWWGEDLMQVCYTPHRAIKTNKEWKPNGHL